MCLYVQYKGISVNIDCEYSTQKLKEVKIFSDVPSTFVLYQILEKKLQPFEEYLSLNIIFFAFLLASLVYLTILSLEGYLRQNEYCILILKLRK